MSTFFAVPLLVLSVPRPGRAVNCLAGIDRMTKFCVLGVWMGAVWVPDTNCPIRYFSRNEAAECLHNKHVIVAGNSVSRHFFSGFLNFMHGLKVPDSEDHRQDEKILFSNLF